MKYGSTPSQMAPLNCHRYVNEEWLHSRKKHTRTYNTRSKHKKTWWEKQNENENDICIDSIEIVSNDGDGRFPRARRTDAPANVVRALKLDVVLLFIFVPEEEPQGLG